MTTLEYVRKIMHGASPAGDSLERAEMAFHGYTDAQLDQEYGQSGETCREILEGYREDRRLWDEACEYVNALEETS